MTETTHDGTDAAFDPEPTGETGANAHPATEERALLQAQVTELSDALLRTRADFANFKRRTEDERVTQREILMERFLKDFLPIADNMERGLAAAAQTRDYEKLVGGVEAVHRQMLALLEKTGVTPMDAVGKPFDAHVHEAMGGEPSDTHAPGTVTAELQRGYTLGSRVLRPALVKVAE